MGSRLAAKLASQGHGVRVLTRDVGGARGKLPYGRLEFFGSADWQRGLSGATGVVNLAGADGRTGSSLNALHVPPAAARSQRNIQAASSHCSA